MGELNTEKRKHQYRGGVEGVSVGGVIRLAESNETAGHTVGREE